MQPPSLFAHLRQRIYSLTRQSSIAVAILTTTALLLGVRHLGGLQWLELAAYDSMVRWRGDRGADARLLIVEIAETDIEALNVYPISDAAIAQALTNLQQYQPAVIGVDLLRNVPIGEGHAELIAQLQQPNVVAITRIGNDNREHVPPPPGVPQEQVGFSDLPTDPDGKVRRNLLFAANLPSLSVQLALRYLSDRGIEPTVTEAGAYQLGEAVFPPMQADSGGYHHMDAAGYQLLLDYRSAERVAPTVSLMEVLNRTVDPALVRGKIVLIGATAPSAKDLWLTPYSAVARGQRLMPGAYLHAQSVSQLLGMALEGRRPFWFLPEWAELLCIFVGAGMGSTVAWVVRNPSKLGIGAIALFGMLAGTCFALFLAGGWIPIAAPALSFLLSGSAVVVLQLQQASRQQHMVLKLLGQQTSDRIAAALWHNRDRLLHSGKLPGRTLTATILFSDLRDFSTISEQYTSEVIMDWLNQYLNAMTEEIFNHQGIVNKFLGDGIMALFGVPIPRHRLVEISADAQNAVCCALAMRQQLGQLNREWVQQGLPKVEMRVGIFTGSVTVGSLGGKKRLEYGAIGDSVNTASRLESCEKHRQEDVCRILIAKETLVHLGGKFTVEPWGKLTLKGKQKEIEVFRVLGKLP